MSTLENMFKSLVSLILGEMNKSQDEGVKCGRQEIQQTIQSLENGGLPCESHERLFWRTILSFCQSQDWRVAQVVSFVTWRFHQTEGVEPDKRAGQIGYELREFLWQREACLDALGIYTELFSQDYPEDDGMEDGLRQPPFETLVSEIMARGGLSVSAFEASALWDAFHRESRGLIASLQTPEVYMDQITELNRVCFWDVAVFLSERLRFVQVTGPVDVRIDPILDRLGQIK